MAIVAIVCAGTTLSRTATDTASKSKSTSTSTPATILQNRQLRLRDPTNKKTDQDGTDHVLASTSIIQDRLELVHIAKSGGTAMVQAAWSQQNIVWADCRAKTQPHIGCDKANWPEIQWMGPSDGGDTAELYKGETWLAPPHWLHPNPYQGSDTFVVVRNPYERVVSEYNDMVRTLNLVHDHREMNAWLQLKLRELSSLRHYPGHFLPQVFYVYDEEGRQVVTHVLRYEKLATQFETLMKMYKLDITLPPKPKTDGTKTFLTKEFLLPETIAMINTLYSQDFQIFNYPMVAHAEEFQELEMTTEAEAFY